MTQTDFKNTVGAALNEIKHIFDNTDDNPISGFINEIIRAKNIYFFGAGRSRLMLSAIAMRFMHIGLAAYVVGDVTTPAITDKDLLIVASGSGETASVCLITSKAKAVGARIALITSKPDSTLLRLSDVHIILPALKQTAQVGGSSFEQSTLILGDCLVVLLAKELNIVDTQASLIKLHINLE